MPQINLAPESQYLQAIRRRQRRIYFVSLLIILLTLIAWGGFAYTESQSEKKLRAAEDELASVETQLAAMGDKAVRVASFESRTADLGRLMNMRRSWIPLLDEIEKRLPPSAVLTSLHASASNPTVQIIGHASTMDEIAQAFASLTRAGGEQSVIADGSVESVAQFREEGSEDQPGAEKMGFSGRLEVNASALKISQEYE